MTASGYLHPAYAESLAEFGTPVELESSGGWILRRRIPGSDRHDSMNCYPLFACANWSGLQDDLRRIPADIVSLTLVFDPFGEYDLEALRAGFDVLVPLSDHFVTELRQPIAELVSRNHRRNARRALRRLELMRCEDPPSRLEPWMALYSQLVERHSIADIRAFSRASFAAQLRVPGLVMFEAACEGRAVGFDLWYVHGDVAYLHLSAHGREAYELGASYALKWFALGHFAEQLRWLDLGAAPRTGGAADGLASFKAGWATGTRVACLGGRIYDEDAYRAEARRVGRSSGDYFPAYREGEFGRVVASA